MFYVAIGLLYLLHIKTHYSQFKQKKHELKLESEINRGK